MPDSSDESKNVIADYDKWKKIDLWQLQEGICLLLGIEPLFSLLHCRDKYQYDKQEFWDDFDEIAKMAERSIALGKLKAHKNYPNILCCEFVPEVVLLWAKNKKIKIPEALANLLETYELQITHKNIQGSDMHHQPSPSKDTKLRNNQLAKKLCQSIARTLWDIYPGMTIEEMKKHHAILEYGGGKYYPGKNTLRDWLSDVDPRPPKEKIGRPPSK